MNRFVVERANAWIDSFKTLLVSFTVKAQNWIALHYIVLAVRLLKKSLNEFILSMGVVFFILNSSFSYLLRKIPY